MWTGQRQRPRQSRSLKADRLLVETKRTPLPFWGADSDLQKHPAPQASVNFRYEKLLSYAHPVRGRP